MKTTTNRMHHTDGSTTWIDKNGKELYTIWANGVIWFYQENPELTFELDEVGCLRRWCDTSINWVKVDDV